jgi:tRNA (guanine6-N2)-methyltransferase
VADYEIELIPGLEEWVEAELRSPHFRGVDVVGRPREGRIAIRYGGELVARLNALRTAVAVHQVLRFDVPRPRGLLGHEHLTRLVSALRRVIESAPSGTFHTLHLSAAGADSAVFVRLGRELAAALHLESIREPAQLQLGIYPSPDRQGWNVSARLSPAPLSARSWRVCNLPGALNATIAHVMVRLTEPKPTDRFLNVGCGSGTLLVERLVVTKATVAIGVDISSDALACARTNLDASGNSSETLLVRADATKLPIEGQSFDAIVSDLPFGQLVTPGSDIATLYRAVMAETTRVVAPGGRFVAITTRKRVFDEAIESHQAQWRPLRTLDLKVPFRSGYLRPTIYALQKSS